MTRLARVAVTAVQLGADGVRQASGTVAAELRAVAVRWATGVSHRVRASGNSFFQQQQQLPFAFGFEAASPSQWQQQRSLGSMDVGKAAEKIRDVISDLWEQGTLFATPKQKRSRNKVRTRAFAQRLKKKVGGKICETCGERHLQHHLCPWCFPFNNWTIKKHIKAPSTTFDVTDDTTDEKNATDPKQN
mmetsp:Transcript_14512/g.26026  ORF Transcript_14512/g.26026 Transcript_14512/m.26026 type:complete len:189 (+) Transcript_14512:104-670(+)|eukprot:CAMPEP_0184525502 /NCGR_PEP_ID=MMETSP0198_2-20121128/10138_1 /TAXON_ID=1112570 /ORGANISM="Thraustochytrium sp., Strain LLF1b" /LENGTH=188 /DNA_ID=CAMNT_0026916977 /DNA_START=51 /DNA_END=617 /DNA_ORIENTATION=-